MARLGQQQTRQQQQTPVQVPTADREMDRLAEEYNAEGMPRSSAWYRLHAVC